MFNIVNTKINLKSKEESLMKKRLVAALCSAVMVFSLAACGNSGGSQNGGEDGQNSDGNSDDEIVEIFW